MKRNSSTTTRRKKGETSAEEIIGILTAISVVSKRMAKKLALLEQQTVKQTRGGKQYVQRKRSKPHAD